jgi:hypothetical protein
LLLVSHWKSRFTATKVPCCVPNEMGLLLGKRR